MQGTLAEKRYLLVDWGYLMFRAIYASHSGKGYKAHPPYLATTMLLGLLKDVGITELDEVIIAVDSSRGSWRKEIDTAYKGNRKALRDRRPDIDWAKEFADFQRLLEQLEQGTPFHVICLERLEADDIIAVCCKHFKDHECIIISADSDYEQLYAYPNVKVFSNITKRYKEVKNPYSVLAKKVAKEVADNLTSDIMNELDFEKRNMIVNLINLPRMIELQVENAIVNLPMKNFDFDYLPFRKSLGEKFETLYEHREAKPKKKKVYKRRVCGTKSAVV